MKNLLKQIMLKPKLRDLNEIIDNKAIKEKAQMKMEIIEAG